MKLEISVRNASAVITNLRRLPDEAKAAVREVVLENGAECEDLVRLHTPFKTGFMQDHVRTVYTDLTFETGWDVMDFVNAGFDFYAASVVLGTRHQAPQDPLTPAFREVASHHLQDVADAIDRALARSASGRAVRPLRRAAARGR
jgi:hypothetical protein